MKFLIPANNEKARDRVRAEIGALNPERPWRVTVEPYVKSRTNDQIRYWFGVPVKLFCEHTGASTEDMHEYLCGEYFGWEEYEVLGKRKQRPVQTLTGPEKLGRKAMSDLFDWTIALGARHGLQIPYPNEDMNG